MLAAIGRMLPEVSAAAAMTARENMARPGRFELGSQDGGAVGKFL
jgi:hypothetical protein